MGREKEKQLKAEAKRSAARTDRKLNAKTFRNQWGGTCTDCGKPVAAQQGFLHKGKMLCEGCGEFLNAGP